MTNDPIVVTPPNDGDGYNQVWAFISRDQDGKENVCGSLMGELGTQPMMTGNPKVLKLMTPMAQAMARQLKTSGSKLTIHLVRFSKREEIEGWR